MKNDKRKNWHCFEDGMLRVTWCTKAEADEWVARHSKCFPGISFCALQYNSLRGIQNHETPETMKRIYYIRIVRSVYSWTTTDSMEAARFFEMLGAKGVTLYSEPYSGVDHKLTAI